MIRLSATFTILVLVILAATGAGRARAGSLEQVRLLSSDEGGLEAEVTLPQAEVLPAAGHPGYHTVGIGNIPVAGEPGHPSLPRVSFWVALPPGAGARVSGEAIDEQLWDGVRPVPIPRPEWREGRKDEGPEYLEAIEEDRTIYAGGLFPAQPAEAGSPATLRHLRLLPVVIAPARWDPQTGLLRIARKVHVRVSFVAGQPRIADRPVAEDAAWQRTYDDLVLNSGQARLWARAPRPGALRRSMSSLEKPMKIQVKATGIKIVSYSDLSSSGWDGAGAPLADLYLCERFHDWNDAETPAGTEIAAPILVLDSDGDGFWSEGDAFCFYAQNLFDRLPGAPQYIKRYGRMNVYWLGLRSGQANPRMATASSWLARQDLTPVSSYPYRIHFEEEGGPLWSGAYAKMGAGSSSSGEIDDEGNIARGVASVRTKHTYWMGGDPGSLYGFRFDLPGFLAPLELAARFQGLRRPEASTRHKAVLYLARTDAETDTVRVPRMPLSFAYEDSALYVAGEADLAGLPLRERANRFSFILANDGYGAALHSVDIGYQREPRFVDGRVEIWTGVLQGPTEYRLSSSPDPSEVLAFDITDPRAPTVLSIDPSTQWSQAQESLRLQWDLTGANRRLTVERIDAIEAIDPGRGEAIVPDTPSDLAASGDQDYVIVIPGEWIAFIQPLLQQRESQGHSVLLAPIEDVYDEFSGGRRWPHAIRSFLRTLFATRDPGPSFLLLVGDATDAFDNQIDTSDPNWVPTQTVFSNSNLSYQGPELVASDQWFVDNLSGTGEDLDFLPDMHIGRLPASSPEQLQNMVDKILAYEDFKPDDAWRDRVLFVSDDAWSSTILFDDAYAYKPESEGIFARSARLSRDVIRRDGGLADFAVDTFFVAQYMDSIPETGRCVINPESGRCRREANGQLVMNSTASWTANRDYGTNTVAPLLWSLMSRGHLFVSFNGHANARLMTHEYVFRHNPDVREDVRRLGNADRPFVFMGYGCHLAEFSSVDEKLYARGDGIGENLLTLYPDRAGVAALASTAYEWLDTTDKYNLAVVRAFFTNPPQHQGHTRWVLGEIVTRSKVNIVGLSPQNDNYQSMSETYTLLGDPGLVMDAAPPRLSVTVDGTPIVSGEALVLPAGQDSLILSARVLDEVWARSIAIEDAAGPVPQERIDIVPDATGDRGFTASYRTTIQPRDYQLILRAEDGTGRVATAEFPVRVSVAFQVLRPGRDWGALTSGDRVLMEDSLRAVVSLPRALEAEDLQFLLDGFPALVHKAPAEGAEGKRTWTLTVNESVASSQTRTIAVRIRQLDEGSRDFPQTPFTIETEPRYAIDALYNVPNPFSGSTWIFYSIGAPADEVTLKIFTAAGRLIRTIPDLRSPQTLVDEPVFWDGRDEDGDAVANGLYFYKLSVAGPQGHLERIEKMARVR